MRIEGLRRRTIATTAAVVMATSSLVVGTSAFASGRPRAAAAVKLVPVLGEKWTINLMGFGAVRPATVFLGGDPTGLVRKIHWHSWGGARVRGTGISTDDDSGVTVAAAPTKVAAITAFDLGTCNGKLMYQGLEWYFPEDGKKFSPRQFLNVCSGDEAGFKDGSQIYGVYPQTSYPACTPKALQSALSNGMLVKPYRCYGSFAAGGVVVSQYAEITAVFLADGKRWKTINRDNYCSAIPPALYQLACDTN